MSEYYFLASLLPPLEIGHVPALGYTELKELLRINLGAHDLEKVKLFLRVIDLENLRALWMRQPLDARGNLNREELEQALLDGVWPGDEEFAPYLREFLEKYHSNEDRLANIPRLMSQFLDSEIENETDFLRKYFRFEREWRLVMVGFRAKKMGRNLDVELQYEDATDPIVAQILAQKDAKVFEPPFEYKELRPIFETHSDAPLELHKALLEYRYASLIEIAGPAAFGMDRILGYMARLLLVERWLELDVQKGIGIVDKIEKEIS